MMWIRIEDRLPPENTLVATKIEDCSGVRNESDLIRIGGLWFFKDMSMYVYYVPTHWRYKEE